MSARVKMGRTLVRHRIQKKTFDVSLNSTQPASKTPDSGVPKELHFTPSQYLAVRNDSDGFYLCKALQYVYNTTEKFSIQWLELDAKDQSTYRQSHIDKIETNSILTNVQLRRIDRNTHHLPPKQQKIIERYLRKSLAGKDTDSNDDSEDEDAEVKEPVKKRSRKIEKTAKKSSSKSGLAKQVRTNRKQKAKPEKSEKKVKKVAEKKVKVLAGGKRKPAVALVPRPNVKILEKDPFMETREKVPFVSATPNSKLVLRAVNLDDTKMLSQLINDVSTISSVLIPHSVGYYVDPLQLAFLHDNATCVKMLCSEISKPKPKRIGPTSSILGHQNSGRYNRMSLGGIPSIRKVALSRGSREGNNAFIKDLNHATECKHSNKYIDFALKTGVSKKTLDTYIIAAENSNRSGLRNRVYERIFLAVRYGHRKLAGELIDEQTKTGQTFFNFLHRDVLMFDNEDLRAGIRAISVKKKPWDNFKITPLHCAAINPNTKYLAALLKILPESGIVDANARRPIHYAAACEGPGPLKLLLNRGMNPDDTDNHGMTALHVACDAGRAHNVEVLLSMANADNKSPDDNPAAAAAVAVGKKRSNAAATVCPTEDEIDEQPHKYGVGGVNQPIDKGQYYGYCPLHLATNKGFYDVVEMLLKYGAMVDCELGASKNKLTPLMIACSMGRLDIVRLLLKHGAKALQRDKIGRSPLAHAAMNGQAHVMSLLLNIGVEIDQQDTSGNTPLHYAVGYGWYFCTQILLDAGANPSIANDWKSTPTAIAFLKGHIGLTDLLLEQPSVDINFRLDSGMTLVSLACSSPLVEGIIEQIQYLVVRKNADCSLSDAGNSNALHHLASNNIGGSGSHTERASMMENSLAIAKLLVKHSCNAEAINNEGMTPMMYAVQQGNTMLMEYLVEIGCGVSTAVDKSNRNILHMFAEQCMQQPMADLLSAIHKNMSDQSLLVEIAKQVDNYGFTPLLSACTVYRGWNGNVPGCNVNDAQLLEKKESWRSTGVSFIEGLIKLCNANPADKIQKMKHDKQEAIPKDNIKRYHKTDVAGFNAIHLLITVEHEVVDGVNALSRVLKILSSNCDALNDTEFYGRTPIMLGAMRKSQSCKIKALLEFGVDLNKKSLNKKTDGYSTALLLAARYEHHEIITDLLKYGSDSTAVDERNSCTSLHYVIQTPVAKYFTESVTSLIASKADVNALDKHENTPLHYLVNYNGLGVCSQTLSVGNLLVQAGAKVNACNRRKRTPLHLAVSRNVGGANSSTAMEQFLIDSGADIMAVDCRGRLPLHYVFSKIGTFKDTSAIDPVELCSTLLSAVKTPSKMVTHADMFHQTPLHLASRRGAGVCCLYLIKNGGDVNCQDIHGNTSLSLAILSGHESCTLLLIQQRADVSAKIFIVPEHDKKKENKKTTNMDSSDSEDDISNDETGKNSPKKDDGKDENDEEEENEDEDEEEEKEEEDEEADDDEDKDDDEDDETAEATQYKPKAKKIKNKPQWFWDPLRKPPNTQEKTSYSVFQGVVQREWQGIMFLMIDAIDSFNVGITTVVKAAFVTNKYNLAKMLIRKMKSGTNEAILDCGQNLAHILAKTCKFDSNGELLTEVAQALFDKGVSFHSVDSYGCIPLHYACLQCNIPLVNFILDSCKYSTSTVSSMLKREDKQGRTPMAAVFWNLSQHGQKSVDLAKILHDRLVSFDVLCPYPVQYTRMYGQQLKRNDSTDYTASSASTRLSPLILAIIHGEFTLVQQLLESGASVNFADSDGRTPLMVAVKENDVNIVRLLLDHSYKIDTTNNDNDSDFDMEDDQSPRRQLKKQVSRQLFQVGKQGRSPRSTPDDSTATNKNTKHYVNGINLACKTYPKKSGVDLKVVDKRRCSVLHYLVDSPPRGCFDNHELLIQLDVAGCPLSQYRDVLDLTLKQGLVRLSTTYQYLLDKKCSNFKQPTFNMPTVRDSISWDWRVLDFKCDAEQFLKDFEDECAMDDGSTGFVVLPDSNLLGPYETWQVMTDSTSGKFYDVLLFKIDVRAGTYGLYNFYKMQVVHQKGKDLYVLFTRWGRIGDVGQFQQTPFPQLSDAISEFKKIFRSKTGNDWSKLEQQPFEHKLGKYRLVPEEERYLGKPVEDVKLFLPESSLPSKLHPYVQDVMAELTDVTAYSSTLKKLGVDQSIFPLGRISKQKLIDAKNVLVKLLKLAKTVESMRVAMPNTDMQKYATELEKIAQLSNEYYHLVPRSGFEYEGIKSLDNSSQLQIEWKNIETLLEMEVATKIMAGALYCRRNINPLDYVYQCLGCKIQLMEELDVETQYILRYSSATFSGEIEAIYRISRNGEDERLMNCGVNTNHKLLFHGSSSSNLISILSRGLLIAPPEAPAAGYRYGKGIYAADKFSKSLGYCYNYSRDSKTKFMLVCQVALGKSKYLLNDSVDHAPPGFNSVIAHAREHPDPKYDLTLPTGAVIPLGTPKKNKSNWVKVNGVQQYFCNVDREYIVYKEDQVALRYLIQFKS